MWINRGRRKLNEHTVLTYERWIKLRTGVPDNAMDRVGIWQLCVVTYQNIPKKRVDSN